MSIIVKITNTRAVNHDLQITPKMPMVSTGRGHTNMPSCSLRSNRQGFVSIMVSLVIMAVMVLITLGFSTLMRREQRQALDRQLSTQAFYAAESGVNDAVAVINKDPDNIPAIDDCNSPTLSNPPFSFSKQLDAATDVEYTCVLIDKDLPNLQFNLPVGKSIIVPVNASKSISSLTITWQDDNGTNPPSTIAANSPGHYLPPEGTSAGEYNVLGGINTVRATFMPVNNDLSIPARNALIGNARTFFFYPNRAGIGSSTRLYSQNGSFVDGACDATGKCQSRITNISPSTAGMYMRLKSVYKRPVKVTVTANAVGTTTLSGSQVLVDSTGRANDVLRRIQVRVPVKPRFQFPEFAVTSMDTICKRLEVWPGGGLTDPADATCGI